MSIYSTIPGLGGDGDDEEIGAPWVYRGSHILPNVDDPRGGEISLALIPSHITRDGRDDRPDDGTPWPWLRVSMDHPDGLINPAQARHVARQFDRWADQADPQPADEVEELRATITRVQGVADWLAAHASLGVSLEADGIRRAIASRLHTALRTTPGTQETS